MKKLLIIFSVLLIAFMGVWVFKAKTPANKPEDKSTSTSDGAWWTEADELPVADANWILDPEIPANYVPVPGEDELYMVVDEDGKIKEYRHREKQEDGSWVWSTINPDIPENYEAVADLEDVYKVTNADGSVSYYKYIRNEDDTFAFVPVDKNGNPLESAPTGNEIPNNYKRIYGNIYAVYNENGVVIGYKERSVDKDGNYIWRDCEKPVIPTNPASSSTPKKTSKPTTTGRPNNTSSNVKPTSTQKPTATQKPSLTPGTLPTWTITTYPPATNGNSGDGGSGGGTYPFPTGTTGNVIENPNGTYTETETIITTETKGGWVITYQTVITRNYDSNGTLISTKKVGPTELSRVKATDESGNVPDKSKIKGSLTEELARVSVGLNYKDDLAKELLAEINAERMAEGVASLTMTSNSDASKLAAIRAADMAIYNHSDYDSPMYGTLSAMCQTFKIEKSAPSEVMWKTSGDKTAAALMSRLQIMSNGSLTSKSYQSIGISIVSKNGYYYIDVVLV